ncbi:MAG: mechanosensitive ion channel family protein, partial [Polyangiaceae bacterium]|nr:mechanosensitive ion channel family protein [Polyangiaceae bacterium]
QFRRLLRAVFILACLSLLTSSVFAQEEGESGENLRSKIPLSDCSTPRRALHNTFYFLQADSYDPEQASLCAAKEGRSPRRVQELVEGVKHLLDARAFRVVPASYSDDPTWTNPLTGTPSLAIDPVLPRIQLARDADGEWQLTKSALDRVAYLQSKGTLFSAKTISTFPSWLRNNVFGIELWQLFSLSGILLLGVVLRKVLQFILRRRLAPLARRLGVNSVVHIVDVFAGPGSTILMAVVLAFLYPQLELPFTTAKVLSVAVRAMVIISVVLSVYRMVDVLADRMALRAASTDSKLDDQLVPLVRKALKIVVATAGLLFLLQNLDVDVGSLLAGLGIGGVAVALAAKDTVANFFGSLMIFIDRPFQIGDWVKVSDVEGIVEEVGFRSTRVRTFYNSLVTIPNAHFTEASIDNLGLREYRRTYTVFNLTYGTTPTQMEAFVEGLRAIVAANPYTRKDYYEIHMSGFGAHSLDVMFYIFFKVGSWSEELQQRHNVYLEVLRLAQELKVEFAFPTQTLHLESVAQPGARPAPSTELSREKMANVVQGFAPGGGLSQPEFPLLSPGYFAGAPSKTGDS